MQFCTAAWLGEPLTHQHTSAEGVDPSFTQVSFFCHTKFTNTGGEILLIKRATTGMDGCYIKVTGTDESGNTQSIIYTKYLSPVHATCLGPFPVVTFGATPMIITYDPTIHIAILEEVVA